MSSEECCGKWTGTETASIKVQQIAEEVVSVHVFIG